VISAPQTKSFHLASAAVERWTIPTHSACSVRRCAVSRPNKNRTDTQRHPRIGQPVGLRQFFSISSQSPSA
jgi:hypothetical protein